jgi:hypothetical protein
MENSAGLRACQSHGNRSLAVCKIFGFEFSKDKKKIIDAMRDPFRQLELFESP